MIENSQLLCRVSSTLNNDSKNYGKKHMFDDDEETCWNSAEGSPQWIEILFNSAQAINGFDFQFQGGFVGRKCILQLFNQRPDKDTSPIATFDDFYPEDVNSLQSYRLKSPLMAKFVRIIFNESTDFYGRVIIYKLKLY